MVTQASSLPLYEVIHLRSYIKRFIDVFVLLLLLSLVVYRFISFNGDFELVWLVSCACEAWFSFIWVTVVTMKWSPIDYKTYPERLLQRIPDLPPVDIFVTTADPELEPPMVTVNTVLSLLAVDYEPHKLACYVSDDACSPMTLYSLIQASEFAKRWVPFCKKYRIQVRAPFRYFEMQVLLDKSPEFQREWHDMKKEYNQLNSKVEQACKSGSELLGSKEFEFFVNMKRDNHHSVVKVILENKENSHGIPHLIYVAREKQPKHFHHYKAGAMNVLMRVSGVMTNAPFMLNVDCDMYINNPQAFNHAMCLLLGSKSERECAYVQFTQMFYNGLKDDPFGNQMVVVRKTLGKGTGGIQGPIYEGTGCFHRRKIISGQDLPVLRQTGNSLEAVLGEMYGNSPELINSMNMASANSFSCSILDSAHKVAGCDYEHGTLWGIAIGWLYGSATEDMLTGLTIHSRGYKTMYCNPEPPSFLGCAPSSGPSSTTQMKRWTTGLLEVFFSLKNPVILAFTSNLQLKQSIAYTWILIWGLRATPELCYSLLPAYCIVSDSAFLPKIDEPEWLLLFIALFVIYNLYSLSEYIECGLSIRCWWNNQRASRINSASAWLFGFFSIIFKLLGLSETVFEVTNKGNLDDNNEEDAGRFTFDESPIFIPATTLVLVNFVAISHGFFKSVYTGLNGMKMMGNVGYGPGELCCCLWILLMFSPFVKGLFCKGKYGIPSVTILKSIVLALGFLSFSVSA